MAGRDGRTEKATPQRLKKARDDGQVARSQEIPVAVSLLTLVATLAIAGRPIIDRAQDELRAALQGSSAADALGNAGDHALSLAVATAGPFLLAATLAGLAGGVAQVGFKINMKLAKPKLKNLDPRKGLEKLKPGTASWELIRSTAKLAAVTVVTWPVIAVWREHLGTDRTLAGGIQRLSSAYSGILVRAALLAGLIAAADYAWQKRKLNNQLKMSKDEIRREHKDAEGDPHVRGQRRRRASELSRNRMLADAATADVLLVNPTHLAVALRYDPADGAPRVVAKGADRIADKLRTVARRNGVPVTRDVPLARALFSSCKVGQHVPGALYEAVAVALAVAYRRSGRSPGSRAATATSVRRRRVRSAA
ncbi:EscU/YscU/HrcU family type III secretion system export apparatus switch protein [Nitriliruptoraceae bacterium ZYF776]|nr:EscU/YscU/HrcU family type III secretion system export apparatus switch protein [Profundirhabdus halotolerans]